MTHLPQENLTPPLEPNARVVNLGLTMTATDTEADDTPTEDTATTQVDPAARIAGTTVTAATRRPDDTAHPKTSSVESSQTPIAVMSPRQV